MMMTLFKNLCFLLSASVLLSSCFFFGTETGNCLDLYKAQASHTSADLSDLTEVFCEPLLACGEVSDGDSCEVALLNEESTLLVAINGLETHGFATSADLQRGIMEGSLFLREKDLVLCQQALALLACEDFSGTDLADAASFAWLPTECLGVFSLPVENTGGDSFPEGSAAGGQACP